jgi:hypothetical protein
VYCTCAFTAAVTIAYHDMHMQFRCILDNYDTLPNGNLSLRGFLDYYAYQAQLNVQGVSVISIYIYICIVCIYGIHT